MNSCGSNRRNRRRFVAPGRVTGVIGHNQAVQSDSIGPRYSPPLKTVRLTEAYQIDEVDNFLERADKLSPEEVGTVKFRTVRFSRGYREDLVDALLDDVAGWLTSGVDVRQAITNWSPSNRT